MATVLRKINKIHIQNAFALSRSFFSSGRSQRTWNVAKTLGYITGTGISLYLAVKGHQSLQLSPVLAKDSDDRREDKRQAMQTAREMRFLTFASVEYQGNIYMTPLDFLESVTEEAPRPRAGRRRLTDDEMHSILKKTPNSKRGSPRLFRELDKNGLISYTEYLFLLCVLTKPQSGFRIAFNMFDTDGNQRVDKKEFLVLEEVLLGHTISDINRDVLLPAEVQVMMLKGLKKLQEKRAATSSKYFDFQLVEIYDHASKGKKYAPEDDKPHFKGNIWQKIQSQMLEELLTTPGTPDRKPLDSRSPLIIGARERGEGCDTTLSVHFFGRKGNDTLRYEDFHRFMDNLQSEVLELEFMEFSRGLPSISEDEFAKILLRYTTLSKEDYAIYLDRLQSRLEQSKGISFKEFKEFGQFLNNLDDFALAMKMYSFLEQPVSEEEFKRATKAVTGLNLTDHLVHVVFQLFDCDGDGHLSKTEFISVMKDRLHRGFRSQVFSTGQWEHFKSCLKTEMKKS